MKINFFGDIALHNIDTDNFSLSDEIKLLLNDGDLNIGNFECPVTRSNNKLENHPVHLKCDRDSLNFLNGFHAFSLANNHLLDYGVNGLKDTIANLKQSGFGVFGAGLNQDEALMPYVFKYKNTKIALIGATRYSYSKYNEPDVAKDSLPCLRKIIKQQKNENCFVVVYFHWGYEYVPCPSPRDRRIAHKCIDYGADLIIGSHPHIMQGMEKYKEKLIFYSLGNFIFDTKVFDGLSYVEKDPGLFRSVIVNISLEDNLKYDYNIYPYFLSENKIALLQNDDKEEIISEFYRLSEILKKSYFKFLKVYYRYAASISRQNIKIREKYIFKNNKKSIKNILSVYGKANCQDILNRLVSLFYR